MVKMKNNPISKTVYLALKTVRKHLNKSKLKKRLTSKAVEYMKLIDLDENVQKAIKKGIVYCSTEPLGSVVKVNEELQMLIDNIESSGNHLVWHVISGFYHFKGEVYQLYTCLIVTEDVANSKDIIHLKDDIYCVYLWRKGEKKYENSD